MIYLTNAFSLSMLNSETSLASVGVERVSLSLAKHRLGNEFVSAIGHETTAVVLSSLLGVPVVANRVSVRLEEGDRLVVAQYTGPRLPEGAITLPEGASFEFFSVVVRVLAETAPFTISG